MFIECHISSTVLVFRLYQSFDFANCLTSIIHRLQFLGSPTAPIIDCQLLWFFGRKKSFGIFVHKVNFVTESWFHEKWFFSYFSNERITIESILTADRFSTYRYITLYDTNMTCLTCLAVTILRESHLSCILDGLLYWSCAFLTCRISYYFFSLHRLYKFVDCLTYLITVWIIQSYNLPDHISYSN